MAMAAAQSNEEWLPYIHIQAGDFLNPFQMGFLIGKHFAHLIRARVAGDPILQNHMIPFAMSADGHCLLEALSNSNRQQYPDYWDELRGTAEGCGVPFLHILLLNFRKEVSPFLPQKKANLDIGKAEDCSDVLVVDKSLALVAHNEDANVSVRGFVYLVRAPLRRGGSFTAYTYAGELPSCAFGFNNHGVAFTLNAVPPIVEEIERGGIGRNFISRDLLEAASIEDALKCINLPNISVGHSYNILDTRTQRAVNVETASKNRISILEIGSTPVFHANMYVHLNIKQASDESSIWRAQRAAQLSKSSEDDILSLLGDSSNNKYPIYMQGPSLYTLCTVLINLEQKSVAIYRDNPKLGNIVFKFAITEAASEVIS